MRDKKDRTNKDDIFEKDYDKIRQIQPKTRGNSDQKIQRTESASRHSLSKNRQKKGAFFLKTAAVPLLAIAIGAAAGLGCGYYLWGYERPYSINLKEISIPSWIEQDFIRKNLFSRPDVTLKRVDNIVIHYVANAGSSAAANRSYFNNLADQDPQQPGTVGGSHFIVGLEGEILQIIPISEITYAAAPRNFDTISIEVCHPDETGKFSQKTYDSLVRLTAWLCNELDLSSKDLIRHHDVSGKNCPKYYVENEDAWKEFKKDVKSAMKK
ncbi:N-acetylmuramoyl-L-alanine amidase [Clostridiaceae bacterium]|nr:N-acetylmuramoyl-L-alanine amidase [Lachnospiraceae bacterium]NBH15918.1 N-acetylmuramoyl-L-alanine amidase [Clostridiaceae bacterium]